MNLGLPQLPEWVIKLVIILAMLGLSLIFMIAIVAIVAFVLALTHIRFI